MNSFPVNELEDGSYFSDALFLDDTFQLLDASVPFTDSIKKALIAWDFRTVQSEGSPKKTATASASAPNESVSNVNTTIDPKDIPQNVSYESVDLDDLLGLPHQEEDSVSATEIPDIPPPPDEEPYIPPEDDSEEAAKKVFHANLDYIDRLYQHYSETKTLNKDEIYQKVEELCQFIENNQRFILRIMTTEEGEGQHFLVNHSMRSTVLALIIGMTLKQPHDKLLDLGVACLLHEIGQIRLPPQLYMTERALSADEKRKIEAHPILSYNILKEQGFPLAVQLAALEHHEQENGMGYPRHLRSMRINSLAKIIAVACSFEAITAPRQFREARTTYEAMIEMLKNKNRRYNDVVLKAMLLCLSVFPIGAYVKLANGKIAQVTNVKRGYPKNPIVQIIGDTKEFASDDGENKIVHVLTKKEVDDLKNQ